MRCCRRLFLLVAFAAGVGAAFGAGMALPPVTGELSGEVRAFKLPGAPGLHWRAVLRPGANGTREGEVEIEGVGTSLRAHVTVGAAGVGSWELAGSELDAATWFPVLGNFIGSLADGVTATGRVELSGRGEWDASGVNGTVEVAWRDALLRSEAGGWSLAGVTLQAALEIDSAKGLVKTRGPAELAVGTVTTRRFGARNLAMRAELKEDRSLAVSEARGEIAGGEVTLDPFVLSLTPPVIDVHVRINHVGLQDVAALVPAGLADARGRVSGNVRMSWSAANGFELGAGRLRLDRDETAAVRLASSPGLLTSHVPERFNLLPSWTGPLAKWFRPKDPAYPEMQAIELGKKELRVESLDLQLTPEGDALGRTATVRIVAKPEIADSMVKQVTFDINVAGPLAAVLKLGMQRSFSVEAR
jgi:hypothetical protein